MKREMYQKFSLEVLPFVQRTLISQISKIKYITLYSVFSCISLVDFGLEQESDVTNLHRQSQWLTVSFEKKKKIMIHKPMFLEVFQVQWMAWSMLFMKEIRLKDTKSV